MPRMTPAERAEKKRINADTTRAAFLVDIDMVIGNLRDVHANLIRECQEHGAGWTKEQEAKWEGAFRMVLGVLRDELEPMRDAWAAGGQFSRKGEEIMAGGEPA